MRFERARAAARRGRPSRGFRRSRRSLVDLVVGARRRLPGEALPRAASPRARSSSARSRASATPAAIDAGLARVEEHGRVAEHLGQRARVGRGDRAAAGHRLERRQPEALVEAREDERGRRGGRARRARPSRRRRSVSTPVGKRAGVVPDAREHEPQLGPLRAHARERLEQPRVVLVRPGPRGVEEERLARDARVGREALVVDAEVDRVDALGIEPEPRDHAVLHPLADHHDGPAPRAARS